MAPLPYLPSKLLSETADWGFASTVQSSMGSLLRQGQELMQPVREQVTEVVRQALPAPAPAPAPEPMRMPEVKPFALPSLESWGMHAPEPPRVPQQPIDLNPSRQTAPAPAQSPSAGLGAAAGGVLGAGGFSLPSLESWGIGSGARPGTPTPAPGGMGAQPTSGAAGPTARAPQPLGEIAEGKPESFFATAGPYARQVEQETGVPAALSLAIAANETGYGQKRYMAGSNNYHGIQARAGEAGAVPYKDWRPGPGGQQQFYDAAQRSFDSPLSGFRGFAQFLTENPRYAPALAAYQQTGDVNALAAAIHKAGYAEDPAYTQKITSIMKGIPVSTGVGEVTDTRGVPLTGATPPQPAAPRPAPGLDVNGITQAYKGVPYTFGGPGGRGQGVGATTDCSGFVSAVWKSQFGLDLAAHTDTSYNQLRKLGAAEVSSQDARPGDVVYYMGAGTGGAVTHHMGIFAGPGKVLDMSTSGTSGAQVRDLGHAGRYVILRDPRVNQQAATTLPPPPPIVPTGIAERTGGEAMRTVQARTPAGDRGPNAVPIRPVAPPAAPEAEPYDPRVYDEGPRELAPPRPAQPDDDDGGLAVAFRQVNGRWPGADELRQLASRVFGSVG